MLCNRSKQNTNYLLLIIYSLYYLRVPMDQYKQIDKIGEGAYGSVFKAITHDQTFVAIKHIKYHSKEEGIPATALRQISLLKSLGPHPHVVRVLNVCYEPSECQLGIVFEYCEWDLRRYIKEHKDSVPQAIIHKILKQLLTGMSALHCKKIMHRDLKPQNIMLDSDKNVKIADFGLARYVTSKQGALTREVQTLWYRAPEVMLGMPDYGFAVDLWAVGCVMAEMYLRRPIFMGGEYEIQQIYKIFQIMGTPSKDQWPNMKELPDFSLQFPKWKKQPLEKIIPNMSKVGIDLLEKMLEYNPAKRITAAQALLHPYFL